MNIKQTLTYLFSDNENKTADIAEFLKILKKYNIDSEYTSIGIHFIPEIVTKIMNKKSLIADLINLFTIHINSLVGTIYFRDLKIALSIVYYENNCKHIGVSMPENIDKLFIKCRNCGEFFLQLDTPRHLRKTKPPSKCLYCHKTFSIPVLYLNRINMKHHYFTDCKTSDDKINCRIFNSVNITQFLRMGSNMIYLESYDCIERHVIRSSINDRYFSCYCKNLDIDWHYNFLHQLKNIDLSLFIWQMIASVNVCHMNKIAHLNISRNSFKIGENNIPVLSNFIYSERDLIIDDLHGLNNFYDSRNNISFNEYFSLVPEIKTKRFPINTFKIDIFMLGILISDIIELFDPNISSNSNKQLLDIAMMMLSEDPVSRPSLKFIIDNFGPSSLSKYENIKSTPLIFPEKKFVQKIIRRIMTIISVDAGFKWSPKSYHLALTIIIYLIRQNIELIDTDEHKYIISHKLDAHIVGAALFSYAYYNNIQSEIISIKKYYSENISNIFKTISEVGANIFFDTYYSYFDESLSVKKFVGKVSHLYSII